MINKPSQTARIYFMDEIRGFAVLCMVFYHAFFLLGSTFGFGAGDTLFNFFEPVQPIFASAFIFISGISCRLSRNNLKRGWRLFAIAMLITAVTVLICPLIGLDGVEIYFGILHFLSVAMLIFAFAHKFFDRLKPLPGILLCMFLYILTSDIGDGVLRFGNLIVINLPSVLYNYNFLFPLGIYSESFFSGDYFAIFPHIFMFFAGAYLGVYAKDGLFPKWSYESRCRFFSWLGRHALIIYIAHMPAIIAVVYIIEKLSSF